MSKGIGDFSTITRPNLSDPQLAADLIVTPMHPIKVEAFMLGTILLILLILLLIGALPSWGYSRGWGYGPSGILGLILIVVIVLLLLGRI